MVTLWRVVKWQDGIIKRDFERVTLNFAIDQYGKRHALQNGNENWFSSREKAVEWKVEYLTRRRDTARSEYERCQGELVDFQKQEGLL